MFNKFTEHINRLDDVLSVLLDPWWKILKIVFDPMSEPKRKNSVYLEI